ncbi:MAG: NUDIX hydrolase [Anaerolineae bacterium]
MPDDKEAGRGKQWHTLSRRLVYDSAPWLTLWEEHVRLPNGAEIPGFIVWKDRDVAMVFAVTADGQVPLVSQYRHGIGQTTLDLPAGYLDEGEDPLVAAQRELEEETGYVGGAWRPLGALWRNSTRGNQRLFVYLAEGVRAGATPHLDETEDIDVHLVNLAELERLAISAQLGGISSTAVTLWGLRILGQA